MWVPDELNATDRQRVEALIAECHVYPAYATALVRAGGFCEYCGVDLLRDRLGYGVGQVDHLLPYFSDVYETPANWVLACDVCNNIKGMFDPACDAYVDAETLRDSREDFIDMVRAHIYARRSADYDPMWHRIMAIMRRT